MKVIFLDIDGVLNDHKPLRHSRSNTFDRDKVKRFDHLLRVTGSKIVLSSSWRYFIITGDMTFRGFEQLMRSHGIDAWGRIVGILPPDEESPFGRDQQIVKYVREDKEISHFVILDDLEDLDFGGWSPHFVMTKSKEGLTDEQVERAKKILDISIIRPEWIEMVTK